MPIRSSFPRAIAATLAVLALLAAPAPADQLSPIDASPAELERALSVAEDLSLAFEHAAAQVAPAVVNVRSSVRVRSRGPAVSPFSRFRNSPFREFFGDEFFERFSPPAQPQPRGHVRQGQGAGFIVSEDGYILTNHHVVAEADVVEISLASGEEFAAEVVGADPQTDLALLKIDATDLTPVRFADSGDIPVGSWVVAVGNPFGLEATITAGIVSATGRSRVGITDYEDFIQTDAAINPGNSGGPLVNLRGEVVGVNTAIATRTGANHGIGFAIPSNLAVSIMNNLKDDGVVTRGWLGVVIQDLDDDLAASFGYDRRGGVLVSQVQENTPAEEAGLRAGDIITTFAGEPLESTDQLRLRVAGAEPGSAVELGVFRDGRERDVRVQLAALDEQAPALASGDPGALGLQLRDLDDRTAARLRVPASAGALVAAVEPLSPAARAGLRAGDVITHVWDEPVGSARDARELLSQYDLSRGVRLTVRSGAAQRFVFLRAEDD